MPETRVLRCAALVVSVLVALAACSCAGPIRPVPAIQAEGFDPEVRAAISTAYQQALAEPTSGRASGRLGMVLQAHAVYQTAALCYQRAIRLEPKEFAWRYYLALVLQQLSQPEQALAALSPASRLRPDYAPAVLRKGDLFFRLGRFRESADAYKSVLSEDPGSALALYGLARLKYTQGDMSGAEDLYSRACRAYQTFGAAYYGLGMAQRSLGKRTESDRSLELAQRFSGDHPPASDALADQVAALATGFSYRLAEGDQLARKGNMEEAARLNEAMLDRDPENLGVLLNLLYLARFVDRLNDKIETFYTRARQINPEVPLIYSYYGGALAHQGKFDDAIVALRKAIELRPDSVDAHSFLGEIYERQNRLSEAIEQYQRALAAQTSDRALQMKLWRLMIIQGRSREVMPELIAALQIEDTYSTLRLVLLGEAYLTSGDTAKARQYLEQARNSARSEGPPQLLAEIDQELARMPPRP